MNDSKSCLLYEAAKTSNIMIVKELLKRGADPDQGCNFNFESGKFESSVLDKAKKMGNYKISYLIEVFGMFPHTEDGRKAAISFIKGVQCMQVADKIATINE